MPWKCPACQQAIEHQPYEDIPRETVLYRCHICRINLIFDSEAQRFKLPPPDVQRLREEFARVHVASMEHLKKKDYGALARTIQTETNLMNDLSNIIKKTTAKRRRVRE